MISLQVQRDVALIRCCLRGRSQVITGLRHGRFNQRLMNHVQFSRDEPFDDVCHFGVRVPGSSLRVRVWLRDVAHDGPSIRPGCTRGSTCRHANVANASRTDLPELLLRTWCGSATGTCRRAPLQRNACYALFSPEVRECSSNRQIPVIARLRLLPTATSFSPARAARRGAHSVLSSRRSVRSSPACATVYF